MLGPEYWDRPWLERSPLATLQTPRMTCVSVLYEGAAEGVVLGCSEKDGDSVGAADGSRVGSSVGS